MQRVKRRERRSKRSRVVNREKFRSLELSLGSKLLATAIASSIGLDLLFASCSDSSNDLVPCKRSVLVQCSFESGFLDKGPVATMSGHFADLRLARWGMGCWLRVTNVHHSLWGSVWGGSGECRRGSRNVHGGG